MMRIITSYYVHRSAVHILIIGKIEPMRRQVLRRHGSSWPRVNVACPPFQEERDEQICGLLRHSVSMSALSFILCLSFTRARVRAHAISTWYTSRLCGHTYENLVKYFFFFFYKILFYFILLLVRIFHSSARCKISPSCIHYRNQETFYQQNKGL